MNRLCLLVAIASMCASRVNAGRAAVRIDVRNTASSVIDSSDPDYLTIAVRFEGVLPGARGAGLMLSATPVFLASGEILEPQGWATMYSSSWYDTGEIAYQTCQPLKEGEDFIFPEIDANAVLKKSDKRSKVIVRFHLVAACRSGKRIITIPLITNSIEIPVPPR